MLYLDITKMLSTQNEVTVKKWKKAVVKKTTLSIVLVLICAFYRELGLIEVRLAFILKIIKNIF